MQKIYFTHTEFVEAFALTSIVEKILIGNGIFILIAILQQIITHELNKLLKNNIKFVSKILHAQKHAPQVLPPLFHRIACCVLLSSTNLEIYLADLVAVRSMLQLLCCDLDLSAKGTNFWRPIAHACAQALLRLARARNVR